MTILEQTPIAAVPAPEAPEPEVPISEAASSYADGGASGGGQQIHMDEVQVDIETIIVGPRRRQKLGNLKSLAKSIAQHGLFHPILVRRNENGMELVAGHRRLEACKLLGWTIIAARDVTDCNEEKFRAIELEENTERLNLEDYEKSKKRLTTILREATAARQEAIEAARTAAARPIAAAPDGTPAAARAEFRSDPKRNSKRGRPEGRPPEAGSKRDVAKRTGISPTEQVRIERHVALADAYPFMRCAENGWTKATVLRAGDLLAKLPASEHEEVAILLACRPFPADVVLKMLDSLASMPSECRELVYQQANSSDLHDQDTALTMALRDTPPPDPAAILIVDIVRLLRRAVKVCRTPTLRPEIERAANSLDPLIRAFDDERARRMQAWHDKLTSSVTN